MREALLMHDALTMLPEALARRQLAGHSLRFAILRPPYPALGVGTLRVLRVRERAEAVLELIVGYDNYERLRDRRTPPANEEDGASAAEPDPPG